MTTISDKDRAEAQAMAQALYGRGAVWDTRTVVIDGIVEVLRQKMEG